MTAAQDGRAGGRPHIGLILPNYGDALDPERLTSAAQAAEAAGFDSGWLTDHVAVPPDFAPVYGTIAEALVTLGYVAARTTRLRIGISALVVPLREPVLALKQLITADYLSGGRVLTAVAAGWLEGEFQTLGASFADRGKRLDEWIDFALETLGGPPGMVHPPWALGAGGWMAPRPEDPTRLELWVAGVSGATLRRAAKSGVWHPVALTLDDFAKLAVRFRRLRPDGRAVLRIATHLADDGDEDAVDERGRTAIKGPPEWIADRLRRYMDAGCDGFVINLDHEQPGLDERVARFGRDVMPLLGTAAT